MVTVMDVAPEGLTEGAQILINITTTLGAVLVAGFTTLGIILGVTRGHAKAARDNSEMAREQVTNAHPSNLRDDLDVKFDRMFTSLDTIDSNQVDTNKRIGRLEHWRETHEDTLPKIPKQKD